MDYLYFELDTTGRSPMSSQIAGLSALKVTEGQYQYMHCRAESLEEEYLTLKNFSGFVSGLSAAAYCSEPEISYLKECFREYAIPFPLEGFTAVYPDSKDVPAFVLPEYRGELKLFFEDYYNYWYFPLEDKAYHKSVAMYTDPSVRKRATRDTACIKKAGTFVPAPPSCGKKLFRKYPDSRECYILKEDCDLNDYPAGFLLHLLLHNPQDA